MSSLPRLESDNNIAYDQSNLTPPRPILRPYAHKGESITHSQPPLTPPRLPMSCLRCVVNKWVRARGLSDEELARRAGAPEHAALINRWRRGKGTLDAAPGLSDRLKALVKETGEAG